MNLFKFNRNHPHRIHTKNQGFSLLEMLVVIAIIAALTALLIPMGRRQIVEQEINGSTQLFINAWQYARGEAIRRSQTVTFCALDAANPDQCAAAGGAANANHAAATANFGNGWAIFVGEVPANGIFPTNQDLLQRQANLNLNIWLRTNEANPIGNLTIRRGGLGLPIAPAYIGIAVATQGAPTDGTADYRWRRTCFGLNGESSAAAATGAITNCLDQKNKVKPS